MQTFDPHQRPPDGIRNIYKRYQKTTVKELGKDHEIIDLSNDVSTSLGSKVRVVREYSSSDLNAVFQTFAGDDKFQDLHNTSLVPVYEHQHMPGLHIIPSLLPPDIQTILLSRLLHRDLSNPTHLTNIHTHYTISYPPSGTSFFSIPPTSTNNIAKPIDPTVHKPLTASQLLTKKMRWTTLGGQYDWTAKRYPDTAPPPFPADIKSMLESLFPSTKAEAAIVNLYSPGDTLSVHRDVAETSATGLISISLGCDAIFMIGTGAGDEVSEERALALRLRSGSAVYMSGEARFAWHGVPQIVTGTCPEYLREWPGEKGSGNGEFESWKGWMAGKRVNLNVRQMWD